MVAWHCRSSWWIHSKSWDIHRYTYISMYYYYYLEMLCVSCKLCVFTSTGPCYVGRNYTGPVVCCHWPWSPELPAPAWTVDAPVCTCRHRGQVSFLPYLFYYLIIIQGYCYWVKANSTGKSWQNTVGIRPSDLCLLQIKAAQIFWGLILTLNVFGWILIWRNLILSIFFILPLDLLANISSSAQQSWLDSWWGWSVSA